MFRLPGSHRFLIIAALLCMAGLGACAGRASNSSGDAQEVSGLSPRELDRMERLGTDYLRQGSCVRASHAFETVVEADPKRLSALIGLGAARWCREQYSEAERIFKTVESSADPVSSPAMAEECAAVRLLTAGRLAEKALDMEEVLPPPAQDSVALIALASPGGIPGTEQYAIGFLLNRALEEAGLGVARPLMISALEDQLALGPASLQEASSARRVARLVGASYALLGRYPSRGGLSLTVLPVLSIDERREYLARKDELVRLETIEISRSIADLEENRAAIYRGLDYFRDKQRMASLSADREALSKRISDLLSGERIEQAKSALTELNGLDREIDETYERIRGFKRELFELQLNVFNVTPEYLREEQAANQDKLKKSRERIKKLERLREVIRIRLKNPIPDSGISLKLPAPFSPLDLWSKVTASEVLLQIKPETPAGPGLSIMAGLDRFGTGAYDFERFQALGLGLKAMSRGDYAGSRRFFENAGSLGPPLSPPLDMNLDELALMKPDKVAITFYERMIWALNGRIPE